MSGGKSSGGARFVKNAAILTVTSLVLRTVGIFFRIYLSGCIGAEGMGLYQLVVSIYVLVSTFATAGICTAVTRLVTDELACGTTGGARRIMHWAVALSVLIGAVSAVLLYAAAEPIAVGWLHDGRAVPALRVLTAGLPFMGVSSCLRGYFMARRKVAVSSRAQLVEQMVRIGTIALLIGRFAPHGLAAACAAVMIGDTLAEIVACGHLALGYWLDKRHLPATNAKKITNRRVMSRLLAIAAPITAGRYLNSLLRTIENLLVPDCLTKYNHSKETSLAQFGTLKGMALPLLFFPSSFLSALSMLLIPEISEAAALRQRDRVNGAVVRTLHLTLTASILIGGVFTLYAYPIGQILYHSEEVGMLLRVLAPLAPVMYLESVVDGILKGLDQQVSSLKYSVLDSVVRIALIVVLVPRRGMAGFLFVMVVSNVLTSLLNLHRLLTVTAVRTQWLRWLIAPLTAVGVAGTAAYLFGRSPLAAAMPVLLSTILGAAGMCVLYAVLLLPLGCVTRGDFRPPRAAAKSPADIAP